jgi:hypothetical protein
MSPNESKVSWGDLGKGVVGLLLLVIIGLWIVSAWLYKQLVDYVLDPMTNLAFSRQDGLVIIVSMLLWAVIWPVALFPPLVAERQGASPEETWQILTGTVLLGLAWGVSVGVKVLADLWWEIPDRLELAYESEQMLGEPLRLKTSSSINGQAPQPPLPVQTELEAEVEEVYGNGIKEVS